MWELKTQRSAAVKRDIETLPSIGPKRAGAFKESGISTLADIISCPPSRYVHRKSAIPIADIADGDNVTITATITSARTFNRKLFIEFKDDSAGARAIFFNPPVYFRKSFSKGQKVLLWGDAKVEDGRAIFLHPDIEIEGDDRETLIPIYPNSASFREAKIGYRMRIKIVEAALKCIDYLEDPLPSEIVDSVGLIAFDKAVRQIHLPETWDEIDEANARLAFDELLLQQVVFAQRRHLARNDSTATPLRPGKLFSAVKASLPFELTEGQNSALAGILERATSSGRSLQLLSGDVGSGKTVVALLLASAAIDSGLQAVFMVPSTLVARQHAEFFHYTLSRFGASVGLLTGDSASDSLKRGISSGAVDLVVGTQALLSDKLKFKQLGLIIIDEQQRFGVGQRLELPARAGAHVLLMSATPIPRTSALAIFGDLDLQVLEGFPVGRAGCRTYIREESARQAIWDFVEGKIASGERAFIVHPRIEGEDFSALKAAQSEINARFPDKTAIAHGSLSEAEKQSAFRAFREGEKPILLATSLVEIGVDVPEATVMVIENPEAFGLAQLHQLRGRIGRGEREGYCILIARSPKGSPAMRRMELFSETDDGFKIAEIDLDVRREGRVLEDAQSGKPSQKFSDPLSMPELLEKAREVAVQIIAEDPLLAKENNFYIRKGIEYLRQTQNIVKLSV
ncbi:MAG TPA: ATP-dependent DNA helicase RecG [candidate division Zixibacteria bacterium]|nr:ATP-dependent DNA helicase RecG [candidate division Zixibacteria bacterium]